MPIWELDILLGSLSALEAEKQQHLCDAVSLPHIGKKERDTYLRRLDNLTSALTPPPPPSPPAPQEPLEHNPEKAAEWFKAKGIKVS